MVSKGSGLSDESGLFLDNTEDGMSESSEQGLRRSRNRREGGPAAGPGEIHVDLRDDCSLLTMQFSLYTVVVVHYLKLFGILALEIVVRRVHGISKLRRY